MGIKRTEITEGRYKQQGIERVFLHTHTQREKEQRGNKNKNREHYLSVNEPRAE
jgi:hypothetical protein